MRRRRKKLYANPLPFIGNIAHKHHPAFLLFFRHRVNQHQVRAHLELRLHVQQRAMSIHHDRLAILAEFSAGGGFPGSTHRNAREDACAAASGLAGRLRVHEPIVPCAATRVNSAFRPVVQNAGTAIVAPTSLPASSDRNLTTTQVMRGALCPDALPGHGFTGTRLHSRKMARD